MALRNKPVPFDSKTDSFPEVFSPKEQDLPVPAPLGWRIIVRPKPAKKKIGMIALAERTRNADMLTRTVGQLVAIGALAWKTSTSGVNLADDPVGAGLKVGDWVLFRSHAAQKLKLSSAPTEGLFEDEPEDKYLLVMNDTDVLAKLTPEQVEAYYDWL